MTRRPLTLGATLTALGTATACAAGRPPDAATPAAESRTATLRVDTLRLWYRVAGRSTAGAPPVVFLHGGPGQGSEHFERLVGPQLEPSLRMVYLDQRGSGRSGRGAPALYTIDKLVSDVDSVRAALGVDRIALVGHSFGGTLALEYAARHPERVAALVFAAGLWDAPLQLGLRCGHANEALRATAARLVGDSAAAAARAAGDCRWMNRMPARERDSLNATLMFPDPRVSARLDSVERLAGRANTGEVGRALGAGLGAYRFTHFPRLTMPVLVIAGRHDGAAVPAGLRRLAERLPNARYVEYDASGHFVYLDETQRFARDVAAFVRGGR
jgi:proline iminopeptidase